jgi:MATE family multidrug resistance protein
MPVVGCAAFTWDGIFIGATGSKEMRNSMLWSVMAFAVVWVAGVIVLNLSFSSPSRILSAVPDITSVPSDAMPAPTPYGIAAMHILMGAYFAHLLARTIYLTVKSPRIFRFSD